MKKQIAVSLLAGFLAMGCGKKNEQPIIEIAQAPQESETEVVQPQAVQQDASLERAYNLMDNATPSRLVCEDILKSFINRSSARSQAVRDQTARIRELCGKTLAFQGDTSVLIECRESSDGDYVPQAIATTKYRCN